MKTPAEQHREARHDRLGQLQHNADGIIQCGSFTADGSGNVTVNLGWEPQFLLVKRTDGTGSWYMVNAARGWSQSTDHFGKPHTASKETGMLSEKDLSDPLKLCYNSCMNKLENMMEFAVTERQIEIYSHYFNDTDYGNESVKKGGLGVLMVHRNGDSFVTVATSVCSKNDTYSKKIANANLRKSFEEGKVIKLPLPSCFDRKNVNYGDIRRVSDLFFSE